MGCLPGSLPTARVIKYDGFLWLLVTTGPLLILQNILHRQVQSVLWVITRRADLAMVLFSIIFFPGVVLHEYSHYLMARLVGVRTGKLSLIPQPLPNGRLQLGYVETASSDWGRDALIGAAPLVTGGLSVAYIGIAQLGLPDLWQQVQWSAPSTLQYFFTNLVHQPDFWLWFYLLFTISSTMLPSASDRRAWIPLALVIVVLLGISIFAGAGPWLAANLAPLLNTLFGSIALVFAISIFVHIAFLIPIFLLLQVLTWLTGIRMH